ncbi:efflux pump antibiotic resistance protein [Pochonia chlamydosporia 170]|uniref:Efflux pump antibiotic resistance protein n=1 Tax=Pochonia chlamydosporia 170 TaxID=1380566 RepID=A0A179F600_METCM|nr:efflux pump antibiotic resistance protein [Pochonia chlamydosporia 170]OAQ60761.1 efflux pump antibiotic resistance protein [Pochonia chlamydosporia 170]
MHDQGNLNNVHDGKGLVVIHVALFRMATRPLAEAYRILGYETHHGVEDILGNPWVEIEQAAEATWPTVPNARPRSRFTRSDWDNLWGNKYDIVTDLACPFTDQLIQAYPDAKVVIVQRDFESWWNSYQAGVLDKIFSPGQQIFVFLIRTVIGSRAADAMIKVNYIHAWGRIKVIIKSALDAVTTIALVFWSFSPSVNQHQLSARPILFYQLENRVQILNVTMLHSDFEKLSNPSNQVERLP